jgi:hypothetical protein
MFWNGNAFDPGPILNIDGMHERVDRAPAKHLKVGFVVLKHDTLVALVSKDEAIAFHKVLDGALMLWHPHLFAFLQIKEVNLLFCYNLKIILTLLKPEVALQVNGCVFLPDLLIFPFFLLSIHYLIE